MRNHADELSVSAQPRERLKGQLVIDLVVPDYYAKYPKACAGGWGRKLMNVTPQGKVLATDEDVVSYFLEAEGVAFDIGAYRDAPAGLAQRLCRGVGGLPAGAGASVSRRPERRPGRRALGG